MTIRNGSGYVSPTENEAIHNVMHPDKDVERYTEPKKKKGIRYEQYEADSETFQKFISMTPMQKHYEQQIREMKQARKAQVERMQKTIQIERYIQHGLFVELQSRAGTEMAMDIENDLREQAKKIYQTERDKKNG